MPGEGRLALVHRLMMWLARAMAGLGGFVLLALVGLICVSVFGRALADLSHAGVLGAAGLWLLERGVGPVLGDFELVEAGTAFAVFAFLPLTQLSRAHAQVDVFATRLGGPLNRALAAIWSLVMAGAILLITWRLGLGMQDKLRYGETTFLIQFPLWWPYAACFGAALLASLCALYCAALALIGGDADKERARR